MAFQPILVASKTGVCRFEALICVLSFESPYVFLLKPPVLLATNLFCVKKRWTLNPCRVMSTPDWYTMAEGGPKRYYVLLNEFPKN